MGSLASDDEFIGCAIEKLAREFGENPATLMPRGKNRTRWSRELKLLGYTYEQRDGEDDPLRAAAAATVKSPLFTTAVNVSLAIRKALRRYLGVEPAERELP